MQYREFSPHSDLRLYIDAYWKVVNDDVLPGYGRILPDGCVDLIINLGEDFSTDTGDFVMQNEKSYLVGTMTRYKETIGKPGTHLLGIRFKPAAFTHFFKHTSLHESTDKTIEFEKNKLPDINPRTTDILLNLDQFFLQKLTQPKISILPIIDDIDRHQGRISVEALSKDHYITVRQLERYFKEHTGLSPKKFISFVRYQFALKAIQIKHSSKSLEDIAFDHGYYDHSHLTNEVKKYSGFLPSQI